MLVTHSIYNLRVIESCQYVFFLLRSSKQLRLNWALFIGETWEDVGAREGDFETSTIALAAPAKASDILSFFPLAGIGDPVIRGMFVGVLESSWCPERIRRAHSRSFGKANEGCLDFRDVKNFIHFIFDCFTLSYTRVFCRWSWGFIFCCTYTFTPQVNIVFTLLVHIH